MNDGITPGYRTTVELDYQTPMMIKGAFQLVRGRTKIGTDLSKTFENVIYDEDLGWMLNSIGFDTGHLLNSPDTVTWWYNNTNTNTAPGFLQTYAHNRKTLTDVVNTNLAAENAPGWQKNVASGGSWNLQMSSDLSSYPQPNPSEDAIVLDRVIAIQETHLPKDMVAFNLYVPGHIKQTSGSLATLYFSGPPGWTKDFNGKGEYALKLFGNGRAKLYETNGTTWLLRDTFRWAVSSDAIFGVAHTIYIASNSRQHPNGDWDGDTIAIKTFGYFDPTPINGTPTSLIRTLISTASLAITSSKPSHKYNVPGDTRVGHPVSGRVRVDLRRDVKVHVGLAKLKFPTTGVLTDASFTMPGVVTSDSPEMIVEWYSTTPAGTSVNVRLFAANGTECSGSLVLSDEYGGQKTFALVPGQSSYYLRVEYTSDGNSTPILNELRYLVSADFLDYPGLPTTVPEDRSALELITTEIDTINLTGKTDDPTQEGIIVTVNDIDGSIKDLMNRAGMPLTVKVDIGEENPVKIFQGFAEQNSGKLVGSDPNKSYGGINFWKYQLTASGEWRRLSEQLSPRRFTWFSQEQQKPFTITRIIRTLLYSAGYPEEMVSVEEIPIRLFAETDDEYVLEPGTPIGPYIIELLNKYLGAYILFDENAGTYGKWRLIKRKKPPYNNLAKFYMSRPENMKLPHLSDAYGTSVVGDQTLVHTYMRQKTITKWVEPPEGNLVFCVGGTGQGVLSSETVGVASYKQLAVNQRSYNFARLPSNDPNYPDPTHPDFLGRVVPIEIYDVSLTTQAAVNWFCRRIFEFSCFARTYWSFEAPAIFVKDSSDTVTTTKRLLRFYDPVLIETSPGTFEQYIITSCNPNYQKDHLMWASYEVCRPSNIDEYAAV